MEEGSRPFHTKFVRTVFLFLYSVSRTPFKGYTGGQRVQQSVKHVPVSLCHYACNVLQYVSTVYAQPRMPILSGVAASICPAECVTLMLLLATLWCTQVISLFKSLCMLLLQVEVNRSLQNELKLESHNPISSES